MQLTNVLSTIWSYAHSRDIMLYAKHLAGKKNVHADRFSRRRSPYKWKLHPKLFNYIDLLWGLHTVDRFAAQGNDQLDRYNVLYWDPEVEAVDALAQQDWARGNNWVNALFWLLPRILQP